jgi:hypothetical protein
MLARCAKGGDDVDTKGGSMQGWTGCLSHRRRGESMQVCGWMRGAWSVVRLVGAQFDAWCSVGAWLVLGWCLVGAWLVLGWCLLVVRLLFACCSVGAQLVLLVLFEIALTRRHPFTSWRRCHPSPSSSSARRR